jgi:hypothetical protein
MILLSGLAGLAIGVLVIAGWLRVRERVTRSRAVPRVDDDALRQILEDGTLEHEDPLDLERAAEEERRFWNEERWDEAEEW